MPYREIALANGEIYHVFNRGVNRQTIFWDSRDYERMLDSMFYYSFMKPQVKYSSLARLLVNERTQVWESLKNNHQRLVDLIAYVFMPNHYHLLLKQLVDNGISKFLSNWQNSFSRYVNTKHDRIGPLFQGQFKAVRITTNAQLLHVSRYIHLNPHTASLIQNLEKLENYRWSSFPEYIGGSNQSICQKDLVLSQFKGKNSYGDFVLDQAGYQKSLKRIRDLTID